MTQQQQQPAQQQRPAKPDPNLLRLRDTKHYNKHTRIALAAMFAIFIVLIGAIWLWLGLTRGPAVVGDRFIELITHNKIDRAYVESSSIELRERLTLDQFTDLVSRLKLTSAKSASWTVRSKDASHADLDAVVLMNDGSTGRFAVTFIEEFDDWKVESVDAAPMQ